MLRRGQTILELVIAVGVISVSTIAALTLIYSTVMAGRSSRERVEATNFAREGVEIIRAIRDSNWLRIDQNVTKTYLSGGGTIPYTWDLNHNCSLLSTCYQYLGAATAQEFVASFTPTAGWAIERRGSEADDDVIGLVTNATNSYYRQKCVNAGSCVASRYRRVIRITKRAGVSGDAIGYATSSGTVTERLDYLDLESVVTWSSTGGTRTVTVKERLYNWR